MFFEMIGGLGLFLLGIKTMSEGLQKAAGDGLRSMLKIITGNRFAGVITGFLITALIQSSSATTVMVVSFVNAGLISLVQSVGVIMGANIGTTITGWLVALIGFKLKIVTLALPAVGIGFFLRFLKTQRMTYWGEVLMGFGLLFLGLDFMKGSFSHLREAGAIVEWMTRFQGAGFGNLILVIFVGAAVTMIIQSSSATMAITMALAGEGLINFPTAAALILGENIGTTITANIAAIGASVNAKRTARAHTLFNIFGVIWIVFAFGFFLKFVDTIVPGEVFSADLGVRAKAIPDHMAAFHTLFNVTNTLVLLPFVKLIAFAATKLVSGSEETHKYQLKYIDSRLMATPSLALDGARQEMTRMAEKALWMFETVMEVIRSPKAKLGPVVEEVQRAEHLVDLLEKEITDFVSHIARNSISQNQSREISAMINSASDLERIGDHCERLLDLARRKYDKKLEFSESALKDIDEIAGKVHDFLVLLKDNIAKPRTNIMPDADFIEDGIDAMRDKMRKEHIRRLNEGACEVNPGLLFIDLLTSFEKIGDHAYNIAEAISGKR